MLYYGTDPESYITEYTLVYADKIVNFWGWTGVNFWGWTGVNFGGLV